MGLVLYHASMSLDGFIAGPDDAMDWVFRYDVPKAVIDEITGSLGAGLSGRNSYDVGHKPGQRPEAAEAYGGAWHGPMFVLTRHPPVDDDPDVRFISGDIRAAVATAREAAAGKNVVVFGATVARECLEAGLVDEVMVHVVPILLGSGVRLYESLRSVDLETIGISQAGPIAMLRYRVVK